MLATSLGAPLNSVGVSSLPYLSLASSQTVGSVFLPAPMSPMKNDDLPNFLGVGGLGGPEEGGGLPPLLPLLLVGLGERPPLAVGLGGLPPLVVGLGGGLSVARSAAAALACIRDW